MNTQIKKILEELYQTQPDLKNQEQELIKIINLMLKEKPQTKFDDNFRAELRQRLLSRAGELTTVKKEKQGFFIRLSLPQAFAVLAGAVVIMFIIILPFVNNNAGLPLSPAAVSDLLSGQLTFDNLAGNAFGNLTSAQATSAPMVAGAKGFGGGGGLPTGATESDKMVSSLMPAYIIYDYKFSYQGEDLQSQSETLTVLKRVKQNNQTFNDIFKRINLGLLDSSKFTNLKIQYLNLAEDKNDGYWLDINPYEGMIGLNLKTDYLQPELSRDTASLSLADVSDDAKFIALADDFLQQYGINTKNYGPGEVDHQWRVYYEKTVNKAEYYFPDTLTIVYPLIINGFPVYEEQGVKVGLSVAVNVRLQKVMSVYNLMTTNFQTSDYQTESDLDRIKQIALKGGLYSYQNSFDANAQVQTTDVVLGTPILGYMRNWQYTGQSNNELFVPAYIFPVIETKGEQVFYKQNIVVPLVKEILDSVDNPVPQPYLERPLPIDLQTNQSTTEPVKAEPSNK